MDDNVLTHYSRAHKKNVLRYLVDDKAYLCPDTSTGIATLNSNWAECVAYDNSFAKVQRLWLEWQPCWPSSMPILK